MRITAVVQENSRFNVVQYGLDNLSKNLDKVIFMFVPSLSLDSSVRETIEKRLKRRLVAIDGANYVVYYSKGMTFRDPPTSSGSPNSSAIYFIFDDKTGLLLQLIPPNSKTSCNYHKKGSERFYSLLGDCDICSCNGKKDSHNIHNLNGNTFTVESNHYHQLSTLSKSAINIVLMPPGSGMSDHHYSKKCIKEC